MNIINSEATSNNEQEVHSEENNTIQDEEDTSKTE